VLHNGEVVGEVTSGSRGPSIEKNVAIAYVPTALATVGTAVQIDIRGKIANAVVTKTPFYTRPY
jgi:aminomethyltransferase